MKKILTVTFTLYFAAIGLFPLLEPEISEAADDTTTVTLTVTSEITVACDTTAALSGTINGITGGNATGNFSCTVTTPDTKGYSLKVKEDGTLQTDGGGANKEFTNYTTNSPLNYDFGTIGSGLESFGFSLSASTTSPVQAYKNNGASCNQAAGSVSELHCWNGFTGSDQEVSNKAAAAGAGELTKFNLRAEAGGSNALQPGSYQNIVTATASVNP
jgi:hypothetical protein